MSDVRLYQTDDGGEITIAGGRFTLDHSPDTAAYLSLFGGNEEDAGTTSTEPLQWWGNLLEQDRARHLRSETQHLLRSLPVATANLRRLEDAAGRDLAWMTTALGAGIKVSARMPAVRTVQLDIAITIDATTTELRFVEPWGSE